MPAEKRTECVKVCFDERMFLDLNREAIRRDRKLADFIYLIVRDWACGHLAKKSLDDEGTAEDRDGL